MIRTTALAEARGVMIVMPQPSKSVFLSYAEADKRVATTLHSALKKLLGDEVWIRDLDLNGGEILIEAISDAVTAAKWFVVLISESSVSSKYLRMEADWASFRAVQDLGVRIVVLRLDKSPLPKHLELALGSQYVVDLSSSSDLPGDFIQVAEYMEKHISPAGSASVYVDRGEKSDEFALLARRNEAILVLGLPGIGKSAFISNSAADKLRKRPLTIRLTRGHSADLLSRQVIQRAHTLQPPQNAQDEELLQLAVEAIKQRSDRYFLFLDNLEEALDGSSQLLPYVDTFLSAVLDSHPDTHVVLASNRNPDIPARIGAFADVLRLDGLDKKYIREEIELLIGDQKLVETIMSSPEMGELIPLVGGHPLAAKLLASFLKVKTPQQLNTEGDWRGFELKLAQYVLQAADDAVLNETEKLMLQVLATVREPILLEDALASKELAEHGLEAVHKARSRLADLFLIEQSGELMGLHPFLNTYFGDQLHELPQRRDGIAKDIGTYAFNKAVEFNRELEATYLDSRRGDIADAVRKSGAVLRYALPAGRLLRSVGNDDLADQLPLRIKGTLRDMVFFFYQEKHDYKKALEFAEKWLAISPTDDEIALQSARCYRNFRTAESLAKADLILSQLENHPHNQYFAARIFREKALVREIQGDRQGAKELFNKGIQTKLNFPYIENYVGLANLLLKEADEHPRYSMRRNVLVRRAVKLLEEARRNQVPIFDRLHLSAYADALIEAGEEDKALPLLSDALRARPRDDRLNYRMAEILRRRGDYEAALDYALLSQRYGHRKAPLTIANAIYGQAQLILSSGRQAEGNLRLRDALAVLSAFQPEYGDDQEVADTISAKVHRTLGELTAASNLIGKYVDTSNPYTIYEQCRLDLLQSEGDEKASAEAGDRVLKRLDRYKSQHQLPKPLQTLFDDLVRAPG
jgi:tetratricopeptide (TPR) repeat protein